MAVIETLLVFSVTSFNFSVVSRSIWPDKFVCDPFYFELVLENSRKITVCVCKAISELKAIICLNTLNRDSMFSEERYSVLQKSRR